MSYDGAVGSRFLSFHLSQTGGCSYFLLCHGPSGVKNTEERFKVALIRSRISLLCIFDHVLKIRHLSREPFMMP